MLPIYSNIPQELQHYVSEVILPCYKNFDAAHQCDHAESVITESMKLAKHYDVNLSMVYTIAAYHDLGLCEGREHHHEVSAQIIKKDALLRQWFKDNEIHTMADAAEDHRASSKHAPRSIYGRIVAEADRLIEPETILRRTLQYGLSNYSELNKEEHYERMCKHLKEKYAIGGYLKLWIPESSNASRLEELRAIIIHPSTLRTYFEKIYKEETDKQ